MVEMLFLVLALAVAYALSMRQAGLWAYAFLALGTWWVWASGTLSGAGLWPDATVGTIIAALPVVGLIAYALPPVRRALLVAPAFAAVSKIP
jgi:hypothetical protein